MNKQTEDFNTVTSLVKELEAKGFTLTLVGGMALVSMGSQRVTYDFDFLTSLKDGVIDKITEIFFNKGFELITKLNAQKEVIRTIDNKNIAAARLKIDQPQSALFFQPVSELRVDLLFDFPISAHEVAGRAHQVKIGPQMIRVASREDLLTLKEIAYKDRGLPTDAQDIEFLKKLKN